ncbi:cytosolic carboxypeptidase 6-like, partial [Anneissia japonica]|uniref:cytosolic carboxypeptidase 6-like n=1 Tax=Anneissia japonica TaxID=1529436 RepID=UPI0014256ABA
MVAGRKRTSLCFAALLRHRAVLLSSYVNKMSDLFPYHFQNENVDFFVDIHAHSTLMNGFMYGNVYDDATRYEKQAVFPKLMCGNADDFSMMNTSFNRDAMKAGTGRRFLGGILNKNTMCYTLEVSFFCYTLNQGSSIYPYDEDS